MMKSKLFLAWAFLFFSGGELFATSTLFGFNNSTGTLVKIDMTTGAADPFGPSGIGSVSDLTFDSSTNRLLGYDSQATRTVSFNLQTGVATNVGLFGAGTINGFEYVPNNGLIYAVHPSLEQLLTVDPNSGTTTVAPIGREGLVRLAFDTGTDTLYSFATLTQELVTIDRLTGAVNSVGSTGGRHLGMAYDPMSDTLFGIEALSDDLVTFNRVTGVATAIGGTGLNGISALAVVPTALVPEPTSLSILVLALAPSILGFRVRHNCLR